jgi:hypothetical protein
MDKFTLAKNFADTGYPLVMCCELTCQDGDAEVS